MQDERIRIMLVDDHPVVRTGLKTLLGYQDDFQVVGEAENGVEAVSQALEHNPDVVLMDITMEGMSGLEAIRRIKEHLPEIKVLVLTVHDSEDYLRQALAAGATGYVLKQAADAELAVAIRAVYRGDLFLYPSLTRLVLPDLGHDTPSRGQVQKTGWEQLSHREKQVLRLVALGYTSQDIAAQLFLSAKTIETYRARVMRKLDLRSRSALVRYALERGLLQV